MRVVIDTNVIISALLKATSPPALVVRAALGAECEWLTSADLLAELARVLALPRIQRQAGFDSARAARFVRRIEAYATRVTPTRTIDVSRDPDDNRVLEAAVAGEADYIVTGDRDLLELALFEGIRIVTPADFVNVLPR